MGLPDWIDVNLPYSDPGKEPVYPPAPDLDALMTEHFGVSWDETETINEGPLAATFRAERMVILDRDTTNDEKDKDPLEMHIESWVASEDSVKATFGKNILLRQKMRQWESNHPLMEEHLKLRARLRLAGTFAGLGFARPGVPVEMANGKQYLIGDVAPNGGVSDEYEEFCSSDIVARYRVLVDFDAP